MMAGYINKHLQPGESTEYRGRVTYLILIPSLFMIIATIVGLVLLGKAKSSGGIDFARTALVLVLVYNLLKVTFGFFAIRSAEFAVTDRRVIGKHGALRRQVIDILFTQISGVDFSQKFFGRIFGYGSLIILANGAQQRIGYIKHPLKFRSAIYDRLENSRLLMGTAAYTLDVRSVPSPPAPELHAPYQPIPAPLLGSPVVSAAPLPPNTPAQWAPDPYSSNGNMRYWDGNRWTEHVSPTPQAQ